MNDAINPCPHCGAPRVTAPCSNCRGFGGWWVQNPAPQSADGDDDWLWRICDECHDSGKTAICPNLLTCPGRRWYPMTLCQEAPPAKE